MPEGLVPVVVVTRRLWVRVGLLLDTEVHRPHEPVEEGEGRRAQRLGKGDASLVRLARRSHLRAHLTKFHRSVARRRRRLPCLPRQRRCAVRGGCWRRLPSSCALEEEVEHFGHEA